MTCTLVTVTGERIVGTNACDNPQPVCPRRLGEGYEKCTTICRQGGHAEVQAVAAAGARARGARAYLQGHTYACRDCQERLFGAGVLSLSVGREPPADCAQPTAKRLLDEFETATHQAARGTSKDIYAREAAREALTAAIEALVEAPREPADEVELIAKHIEENWRFAEREPREIAEDIRTLIRYYRSVR